VGTNYLERLRVAAREGDRIAGEVLSQVHALFAGQLIDTRFEYETGAEGDRRIFTLRLIRFDLGSGPRVTVIHRDITETRHIERSLRESEERWKFAIDGSGDAVWDWDLQRNSMHRSAHFFKMLGRSSDAGYDTFASMQDLVHPDDAALVKEKYAGLISGNQDLCAFEHRLSHRDGSWRWIMARCTVTRRNAQGDALRILGVHTDITALKQAESQLRAKQAEIKMLAMVAENTTNSVLITNASGLIEWANRGFEAMTGYALKEVKGLKPGSFLQGPGTDPDSVDLMRRQINAGEPVRIKILNFRKDQRPIWVSIEIQPVRIGADIRHFVAVMEDVTENEKLEAERRLSQKLQSVGQLAAGIAHEINTPVQFVGDSLTFLDEAWQEIEPLVGALRVGGAVPESTVSGHLNDAADLRNDDVDFLLDNFPVAIARARDGLQRVSAIVRAMKELAHPDQREFSRADVNRAVQNAIVVARNEYKYFGIVETHFGTLPMVKCRISSVSQVLMNLIVNAGHALADQGHTPESGKIGITTRRESEYIVIAVSDNGCGIPDQIRDRIFDPFFTSKEVGRGTGQGLAIARAIVVEQHGGRIVVQSKAGAGSTFEVWLPIEGPLAAEPMSEAHKAAG
jgi:PAS domain S-box-containing protein